MRIERLSQLRELCLSLGKAKRATAPSDAAAPKKQS
jgi:hypothetical protein